MIVIYHANCDDGFAAACVLRRRFGEQITKFIPAHYGEAPPWLDIETAAHVYIVDFSYKRPVMIDVIARAAAVTVLDHHVTAQEELEGIVEQMRDDVGLPDPAGSLIEIVFDMERSGATMTWDYCFPGEPRPRLIERIEDNDLWRTPRRYADSVHVQAALRSYPQDFDLWARLMDSPLEMLEVEGVAIRRYIDGRIAAMKEGARIETVGGVEMPVVNAPSFWASDLAGQLAEDHPSGMAACYCDLPNMRVYSLRARKGVDVSEIAKKYGGGGHKGAAGFQVPRP